MDCYSTSPILKYFVNVQLILCCNFLFSSFVGYFSNLLENIWMCLEGCTNDYTKTVLSSDWDDFEDKQCRKFFTSLVNLLSAFPSVFELLNIEPRETRQQEETELSETSLPVTSENTFQVPETFEELLQNLVFIESSERMRLLFRFERSHFFGLRVISSLVSCLDTFLLMQSKFRFQESLLRFQESQKLDNGDYIIDNCSVERNQILVRTYSIGGPTERTIPPRNLTTVGSIFYFFVCFPAVCMSSPSYKKTCN